MSIEKSPSPSPTAGPASSHKAAGTAASHGVRTKAAGPDASADGGGFMAILGALGDASADPVVPLAADDATSNAALAALPDAPAFDASTLLQQNPQIAAAQALQAAADGAAAAGLAATNAQNSQDAQLAGTSRVAGDGADPALSAAGLGAVTAAATPLTHATGAAQDAAASAPGSASRARPGDGAAARAAGLGAESAAAGATPEQTESLTAGLQHAAAQAKASKQALRADVDSSAGGVSGTRGSANTAAQSTEPNKFLAALEPARAPQAASALAPLLAPLMAKADRPQGERSARDAKSADPTYAGTALGVSAPDFSQSAALVPAMAPDMQAAEQVSYWVSHNVQNAELKLDGLGQSPVEVSISLQGNEAHISFRTDEAATRGVLESAGVHLKDMLQREGLVLTGVSVGSSGSGNADGGERRGRPNARQALIAPVTAASADSGARLQRASLGGVGRSVDLFA